MLIGAGTVLDVDMAKDAVAAGAQYLVSPNVDKAVIQYARDRGIGIFPGAMTPTEIVAAWRAGATAVKLFPMASLGIDYLQEIRAPLDSRVFDSRIYSCWIGRFNSKWRAD
ncbi:KHG/KDPG aldolase [compost metagenome]